MNAPLPMERDERTMAVENAGCSWAYALLSYALLLDGAFRGLILHEAAWDLLALVIVSGAALRIYQGRKKALPQRWLKLGLLVALVGGIVGAIVALIFKFGE